MRFVEALADYLQGHFVSLNYRQHFSSWHSVFSSWHSMHTLWQSEKGRLWLSIQPKLAHFLSASTVCQPENTLPTTRALLTVQDEKKN